MKRILVMLFTLIFVLSLLAGCSGGSDSAVEESSEEQPVEEEIIEYTKNENNNQFINDYNGISNSPFTDVKEGGRDYYCHAYSYGYYFEIRDMNEKAQILINQADESFDKGVPGMNEPIHDVVKTLDSSLSDDDITTAIDSAMNDGNADIGKIHIFVSHDVELSSGLSRGHAEVEIPKE